MNEKFELKYDKVAATYAWRFRLLPEFDIRKNKVGFNNYEGFSKFEGQPEIQNKKHLLINCMSSLFSNGWIQKSSGIDVYIRGDYWRKECKGNERILCIRMKNGIYRLCNYKEPCTGYEMHMIDAMVKDANYGKVEILKVVKEITMVVANKDSAFHKWYEEKFGKE